MRARLSGWEATVPHRRIGLHERRLTSSQISSSTPLWKRWLYLDRCQGDRYPSQGMVSTSPPPSSRLLVCQARSLPRVTGTRPAGGEFNHIISKYIFENLCAPGYMSGWGATVPHRRIGLHERRLTSSQISSSTPLWKRWLYLDRCREIGTLLKVGLHNLRCVMFGRLLPKLVHVCVCVREREGDRAYRKHRVRQEGSRGVIRLAVIHPDHRLNVDKQPREAANGEHGDVAVRVNQRGSGGDMSTPNSAASIGRGGDRRYHLTTSRGRGESRWPLAL